MNENFYITDKLLKATFAGLTRDNDEFVYFDFSNGNVFSYVNGYFSSLMDNDQSISNRQLMNKILVNSPKDIIDLNKHILIEQLKLTEFLKEYSIQAQGTEPFLSYSKFFQTEISSKYGITINNIFFNTSIFNKFHEVFTNKYVDQIEDLRENYTNIFENTCKALGYNWIQKNLKNINTMVSVKIRTSELIEVYKNKNLMNSDLRLYYHLVMENFNQVIDFDDYSHYRFSGILFNLMLDSNDFEHDPDIRQSMASIAFYILSKGMEKFCLDENNLFLSEKSYEQIELVSTRISILLESKESIKYSLRLSDPSNVGYFSPLSSLTSKNVYDYEDLVLYDSYVVKKLCTRPGMDLFMSEPMRFANLIYEDSSTYGDIQERLTNGKNSQIRLYQFLKNKFEFENDFIFD